jgi:hypothetical protein
VTAIYITTGLITVILVLIWLVISLSKSSAKSKQALREANRDIDALKKFTEEMAKEPLSGQDLLDSLRSRSGGG